jgi:2'-5' RNA ligase
MAAPAVRIGAHMETGQLPRLFTGLEVPYDVQLALSLKRGGLFGARWIDPENYHITLCFIGDVDNHVADEVSYELDRAANFESFRIRLSHLGTFGGDKPRALYAGIENNDQLQRLQATHERILRRVGLTPDARKFVPHISLARLRGTSAIEVADLIHHMGQFAARIHRPAVRPVLLQELGGRRTVSGGTELLARGGVTALNPPLTIRGRQESLENPASNYRQDCR